jgi:hypothetical protein
MSGCFGRWRGTKKSGRCNWGGQGWEALSTRSHRAPLTALGFASAWRRKLAAPLALQRRDFGHSSPPPAAVALAQQERSPNGALIMLQEPPSPGSKMVTGIRGRVKKRKEACPSLRAIRDAGFNRPAETPGHREKERTRKVWDRSARAITQRRSNHAPRAFQPLPLRYYAHRLRERGVKTEEEGLCLSDHSNSPRQASPAEYIRSG